MSTYHQHSSGFPPGAPPPPSQYGIGGQYGDEDAWFGGGTTGPAEYSGYGMDQPFSLVLDAEGCLDRLYGGYYSGWIWFSIIFVDWC